MFPAHLAMASGYLTDGNKELRKGEVDKAIQLYTEGVQANCGDTLLNAKIYSSRATAHFSLGRDYFFILIILLICIYLH